MKRIQYRDLSLAIALVLASACASSGPQEAKISVEVITQPEGEAVALRGRKLGPAPVELTTPRFADVLEIGPVRKQLSVVERRVVVVDPDRVRVYLRMDGEPSPLARQLGLTEITVFDYGDRATFDVDSFDLEPSLFPMLRRQADLLSTRFSGVEIYLCGHTDSSGESDHNELLSLRRAEAVAEFLVAHGVSEEWVKVQGFGPDFPIASNATPEGMALNRRTEIILPD